MLFHPCPFEGKHTFFNITPPSQVYNVLMPGTLKFSICVLDATNTTLFSLTSYLKVLIEIFQKRGNKYFQFYKAQPIDWCKLNKPNFKLISIQKFYIEILSKPFKGLFHPCPFEGRHRFDNISLLPEVLNVVSSKSMQIVFQISDSKNFMLFSLTTNLILSE
ncbi:unnamed protein product [Chironomus riparius]|uniref:Uncharacterized protein n=1 Tax=Chironomus riparius TaxID=315576 RepID=A0A9N9WNR9_9DIPT|nr:unnamed protein product [Chironomus riparius]